MTPSRRDLGAPAIPSPFLTTAEAAAYCRYRSPSANRNLVIAGRLRPDGKRGRAWLFKRETLEAMLAGYGAPMAPGECSMPKQKRYPGIIAMPDGLKRIRLRAVDLRTGRMSGPCLEL